MVANKLGSSDTARMPPKMHKAEEQTGANYCQQQLVPCMQTGQHICICSTTPLNMAFASFSSNLSNIALRAKHRHIFIDSES